jgi:hypothetical protein
MPYATRIENIIVATINFTPSHIVLLEITQVAINCPVYLKKGLMRV